MYDGGVRSILLLPLVARCLETIDVCMWCMLVCMFVVGTVWGSVGMFVVYQPLLKIMYFSIRMLKYVCVRDVMDVVFSVCIVTRGTVGARVW